MQQAVYDFLPVSSDLIKWFVQSRCRQESNLEVDETADVGEIGPPPVLPCFTSPPGEASPWGGTARGRLSHLGSGPEGREDGGGLRASTRPKLRRWRASNRPLWTSGRWERAPSDKALYPTWPSPAGGSGFALHNAGTM